MPKLKNVSPLGDLDVALLGRVVEAGEVVEVTAKQAEQLGAPSENFALVREPKKTAAKKAAAKKTEAGAPSEEGGN